MKHTEEEIIQLCIDSTLLSEYSVIAFCKVLDIWEEARHDDELNNMICSIKSKNEVVRTTFNGLDKSFDNFHKSVNDMLGLG